MSQTRKNDTHKRPPPTKAIDLIDAPLSDADMNDLCDATDAAIQDGGGFGWVELPSREILERYWNGVITMPARLLFVVRLDGVICGTGQILKPPINNEAQSHAVQLTTVFVAPWARGHGLGHLLLSHIEDKVRAQDYSVINLDVRETMVGAIALYEKNDYVRYATHPDYARIHGSKLKGYFYTKSLG